MGKSHSKAWYENQAIDNAKKYVATNGEHGRLDAETWGHLINAEKVADEPDTIRHLIEQSTYTEALVLQDKLQFGRESNTTEAAAEAANAFWNPKDLWEMTPYVQASASALRGGLGCKNRDQALKDCKRGDQIVHSLSQIHNNAAVQMDETGLRVEAGAALRGYSKGDTIALPDMEFNIMLDKKAYTVTVDSHVLLEADRDYKRGENLGSVYIYGADPRLVALQKLNDVLEVSVGRQREGGLRLAKTAGVAVAGTAVIVGTGGAAAGLLAGELGGAATVVAASPVATLIAGSGGLGATQVAGLATLGSGLTTLGAGLTTAAASAGTLTAVGTVVGAGAQGAELTLAATGATGASLDGRPTLLGAGRRPHCNPHSELSDGCAPMDDMIQLVEDRPVTRPEPSVPQAPAPPPAAAPPPTLPQNEHPQVQPSKNPPKPPAPPLPAVRRDPAPRDYSKVPISEGEIFTVGVIGLGVAAAVAVAVR